MVFNYLPARVRKLPRKQFKNIDKTIDLLLVKND